MRVSAGTFIKAAREHGFTWYTGVPCSYLTAFINYVINDDTLSYVSSANEGDAVATAAGLTAAGQPAIALMQNSGLGNAVNPLTSLTFTFDIPVLLIVSQRGQPGYQDEPQHELMGRITGDLLDLMEIPWERFPTREQDIYPALERAARHCHVRQKPYALVLARETVRAHPLEREAIPARARVPGRRRNVTGKTANPTRGQALREIVNHTPTGHSILVATTGYTGRELCATNDRSNQIYLVGSMGCASSFALGISLARPELEVTVIDGDGAGLMRMGNFATIGSYGQNNLIHILLDNGVHESTGSQATVSANVSFADIAAACGYGIALAGSDLAVIRELFSQGDTGGARFAHLKIAPGTPTELPRPTTSPKNVLRRLFGETG